MEMVFISLMYIKIRFFYELYNSLQWFQFFITHVATPWLDNNHTVFGKVEEGQNVVDTIAQGDTIESLEIVRIGADAQAYNAVEAFRTFEEFREKRY